MLGLLAHAAHLGLVLAGLAGVVALLLPTVRRPAADEPTTLHARRVEQLREAAAQGRLGTVVDQPAAPVVRRDAAPHARSGWRSFAVISSAAAGIVHLAVFPHHLTEGLLLGVFFVAVASWQGVWAWQVSRQATSQRLWLGLLASVALIALWAWSRTTGLPLGFTDGPEPVGAWDLSCITWQVCVVAACWRGLRVRGDLHDLADLPLGRLGASAWAWASLSAIALLTLSVTATVG